MVYKNCKHKWKYNLPVSPEVAVERFCDLEQRDGELTPKNLLDSARPEQDPMHPLFEWNDSVAAERFRLHQSRMIIGNLVCVVKAEDEETGKSKTIATRAFVNVAPQQNESKCVSLFGAMGNEERREAVLKRALNELSIFRSKYAMLYELAEAFTVIDKLVGDTSES